MRLNITHSRRQHQAYHGRPHIQWQMGSADPFPGKMDEKLKSENMIKKSNFLCLCYILRAIRAGTCRERRYADLIFIQIQAQGPTSECTIWQSNFQNFLRLRRQGGTDPVTKILRTFLRPIQANLRHSRGRQTFSMHPSRTVFSANLHCRKKRQNTVGTFVRECPQNVFLRDVY